MGGRRNNRGRRKAERSAPPSQSISSRRAEQLDPVAERSRTELYAMGFLSLSGPLPPPQILQQYDQVVPGGAERIVGWVEKQSSHRQELEKLKLRGDLESGTRGQWFGLIVTLSTLAGSVYLILQGKDITGISLIITELAVLAGIFVYGRESQRREREKMREDLMKMEGEN